MINGEIIGCDTETTGLNPWKGDRPFIFTFANEDEETEFIEFPVGHKTRNVKYWSRPAAYRRIKEFYADEKVEKTFHNLKFDLAMINAAGIEVRGPIHCSLVGMKIAVAEHSYELKPLCRKYFDIEDDDEKALASAMTSLRGRARRLGWKVAGVLEAIEDLEKKKSKDRAAPADYWLCRRAEEIMVEAVKLRKSYRPRDIEKAREQAAAMGPMAEEYARRDAVRAIYMWLLAKERLEELGVYHIYEEEIEQLLPVVMEMERRGVWLDKKMVRMGRKMEIEVARKNYETIEKHCGKGFNPNSYVQKTKYFIEDLGLEPIAMTDNGNPSIDNTFLQVYAHVSPAAKAIIDHGKANKARSTYFDNYIRFMCDGVLHCNHDQVGARTGRFSVRNPALQTVPKRGECQSCGKDLKIKAVVNFRVQCGECQAWNLVDPIMAVRRPFRPRPGHIWYLGDYKQIEARIFADAAEEETMIAAFSAGDDPYDALNMKIAEITELEVGRQHAKGIFLGKLYGLGVRKMQMQLMEKSRGAIDRDLAMDVIDAFDTTFPAVREFMQEVIKFCKQHGYIENVFGQKIPVPRDEAYKGINYKIQSEAARVMKRAMIRTAAYLRKIGFGWLLMTIHDELVFEFLKNNAPVEVLLELKEIMEDNDDMFKHVKLEVDFEQVERTWLLKSPCEWATAV